MNIDLELAIAVVYDLVLYQYLNVNKCLAIISIR